MLPATTSIRQTIALTATVLFAVVAAAPASAQMLAMQPNNLIQLTEQAFEQNVFGNRRTYEAAKKYVDESLETQIEFVDKAAELTEDQRAELELAGRVDIHRFFCQYQEIKREITFGGIPRDEWQAVWQKTRPVSNRFNAGLHGSTSLFAKSIATILSDDQMQRFKELKAERDKLVYEDHIRMTLALVDRKVALTTQQRKKLTEMLLKETKPPTFYGTSNMCFYVVLGKLANLPREDVKSVFHQREWRVVEPMLRQAQQMEKTIEMQLQELAG